MSNYGKNFPEFLYQAAAQLIGLNLKDGATTPTQEEITGAHIQNALIDMIEWFQRSAISAFNDHLAALSDHKDYSVTEVARLLLEMTILYWDWDKPENERMTRRDFRANQWCRSCYEEMIGAFLDLLYGYDFNESINRRVAYLYAARKGVAAKQTKESIPQKKTINISVTSDAIDLLNKFYANIEGLEIDGFLLYVIGKMHLRERSSLQLTEAIVCQLINEYLEDQKGTSGKPIV